MLVLLSSMTIACAGISAAATADGLVEAMFGSPHLVVHGGAAVIDLVGHAAGPAAEAIGGAAEGVFSAVLDIISGLFDGL